VKKHRGAVEKQTQVRAAGDAGTGGSGTDTGGVAADGGTDIPSIQPPAAVAQESEPWVVLGVRIW
jgi:hypothetical protein